VLKAHGYNVRSSDLVDRGYGRSPVDFLRITTKESVANVVTNRHIHLQKSSFELLWKFHHEGCHASQLTFLESERRRRLFESTPLARVHVFSKRLTLMRNGAMAGSGGMIAFAWFVWEHGYSGRPRIGWLCT